MGRSLPSEKLRVLRSLTTRRAQIVETRKRLVAQIRELELRIAAIPAQEKFLASKADLLRAILGIRPAPAAVLPAEMPELGRMTAGEAASMTGLALPPHDPGRAAPCGVCCSRPPSRPYVTTRF